MLKQQLKRNNLLKRLRELGVPEYLGTPVHEMSDKEIIKILVKGKRNGEHSD